MGHEVFAFSRSHDKQEMIQMLGGNFIDSSNSDSRPDLSNKFDFILSTLNVDYDLNAYIKMLKPQGKFCFVAQPPNSILLNAGLLYDYAQRTIYENYTGSRKNMKDMLAFSAKHTIKSIVDVMPFGKLNEAIDLVGSGKIPMRLVFENRD